MQYSLKELNDELDFVNEKLKDTQKEFERFKDARAEIWTRHDLTRYERSRFAACQDWTLSCLQGEIAGLIQAQIKLYVMIAELEQDEKENEIVNTEINDAKIISEDVSMSTERQEFVSDANQEQFLDEESNWKLIAQLELEEYEIKEEMEVTYSPESATAQIIQETTVADRQEKEIEKAAIVYPDVYA